MDAPKKAFDERRQNCTTACGDVLRSSGLLGSNDRPERGLFYDSPEKLKDAFDQGVLSGQVKWSVVFDPEYKQNVTPEEIDIILGIKDNYETSPKQ